MSRKNKKKLERRRKTRRRQLGGGATEAPEKSEATEANIVIDSVSSWVEAVNKTAAFDNEDQDSKFKKQPDEKNESLRLGAYKINELTDEKLKLPPRTLDSEGILQEDYAFKMEDGSDFRDEAAALRYFFEDIIEQEDQLTPAEFMKHMSMLKADPDTDIAIKQQMQFAEKIECNLQKLGRDREVSPEKVLIEEENYPLYILTLFANTDAGNDRPLFLSAEEFGKQFSKGSIPDSPVE